MVSVKPDEVENYSQELVAAFLSADGCPWLDKQGGFWPPFIADS